MHWVLTSSDDARLPDCGYHQSPKLESHRLQSGSAGGTALSCLFFVNGGFDLRGQFGGELLHSMRGASVLEALFQHFLLGLTSGNKVTIHPNISACNHFSHTMSSNSLPRVNPRETISIDELADNGVARSRVCSRSDTKVLLLAQWWRRHTTI